MSNKNFRIWNEDCITGASKIEDNSIDLIICDPPFGISESTFSKYYKRNNDNVISGYVEAPDDYDKFTLDWMTEAHRILKDDGSMYIVSGWTNLSSLYKAIEKLGLIEINHIIWKFNFGVNTKNKFVTSHYHILYLSKSKKAKRVFNTNCRFTQLDKDIDNGSLLYKDMEDVWVINKEYQQGKEKNANKLPNKLVEKMIEYSSNDDDIICDFFLGNFTTADCALRLGRKFVGFELNSETYNFHISRIEKISYGVDKKDVKNIETPFFNQGKKLTETDILNIKIRFNELKKTVKTKKEIIERLCIEFGRGRFSIINILEK